MDRQIPIFGAPRGAEWISAFLEACEFAQREAERSRPPAPSNNNPTIWAEWHRRVESRAGKAVADAAREIAQRIVAGLAGARKCPNNPWTESEVGEVRSVKGKVLFRKRGQKRWRREWPKLKGGME